MVVWPRTKWTRRICLRGNHDWMDGLGTSGACQLDLEPREDISRSTHGVLHDATLASRDNQRQTNLVLVGVGDWPSTSTGKSETEIFHGRHGRGDVSLHSFTKRPCRVMSRLQHQSRLRTGLCRCRWSVVKRIMRVGAVTLETGACTPAPARRDRGWQTQLLGMRGLSQAMSSFHDLHSRSLLFLFFNSWQAHGHN